MSILSAAMTLFLVMDSVGNVPMFAVLLENVEPRRRSRVIVRENLIALTTLLFFLALGPTIMRWLRIEEPTLNIAGGLVLLIVALEMIFPNLGGRAHKEQVEGEPFIVPLAIPMLAGPSTMALIMLMITQAPADWAKWLVALTAAWATGLLILLSAGRLRQMLGARGLAAAERLMGMILLVLAIQMSMTGLESFFSRSPP